jgi:HlyD family secretion protein
MCASAPHRPLFVAALGLFLTACSNAAANAPEPLQGVLEYEDRILGLEVGGRVASVEVRRGDRLEAGAVLIRLDDTLERPLRDARAAELEIARAQLRLLEAGSRPEEVRGAVVELEAVKQQLVVAERQRVRQASLVEGGAAPASVLDTLEGEISSLEGRKQVIEQRLRVLRHGARAEELEAAEGRVAAAAAALATVEARLTRYVLATPDAGDVVDLHVERGEIASPGAAAVTIADLDHPYVDVFVPQSRMSQVRVGLGARVHVDGVDRALGGHVEHVFPTSEFTPRFLFSESERPNIVLRVRVRIDDPDHVLHAGIPAFVELVEGGA